MAYLRPHLANLECRFYDIAWGGISNDKPKGIIAGGMESGSLNLWSADTLLDGSGFVFPVSEEWG
jgi:protein transport protein SEC31